MKRLVQSRALLSVAILLLFVGSASAQKQKKEFKKIYYPSLRVILDDPDKVLVISVDGKMYSKISRSIQLDRMTSGRHLLTVYRVKIKRNGKKKYYEYFTGYVNIRPEVLNIAKVNRRGYLRMNYAPLNDKKYYSQRTPPGSNPKIYKIKPKYKEEYAETSSKFGVFMQKMDETHFESQKLIDLADYLKESEGISTDQLAQVFSSFQFESSKIEATKIAKNYLLDPENVFRLRSVFEMQSYKEEFDSIISELK